MNTLAKLDRLVITRLDRFIDDTLNKANAVNKPYRAIKQTDAYKAMQSQFADGIKAQGQWASDNLPKLLDSIGVQDDLQPLALDQTQKLKGQLKRDMPALTDHVTEFKVFSNLKDFFEWGVKQQYKRWGYMVKSSVNFELSNTKYINSLKDRAAYLLNQSSLDETTISDIIDTVSEGKLDGMTNDEVSQLLSDRFNDISSYRGDMIARTESANALGDANLASAQENGASTHEWVCAGGNPDELCQGNEDDGEIPIDQSFSSGDDSEPAHPNCECYTQAGEINLDSIDIWGGE